MMKSYLKLLKQKLYIGFLIVCVCACFGSIRGAWKESGEGYIWITGEDIANMHLAGKTMPDLTGIMALASEQNRWYNFDYALIYAERGFFLYCLLMAVYMPCYHWRPFAFIRNLLGKGMEDRE